MSGRFSASRQINDGVDDPKLEKARRKLAASSQLDPDEPDTERAQEALEGVVEARRLLAQVRKDNLKDIQTNGAGQRQRILQ